MFTLALCFATTAQVIEISTGILAEATLWQTSPAPFADFSTWGGLSLAVLIGTVTIDAMIEVTDFESLTIANESTLYFTAKLGYARIGPMTLEISGGLSVNPAHSWMALDVGLGATIDTPIPYTELRTRVLYAWTQGSRFSAAGSGIAVDLGIFVTIPLF